MVVVPIGIKTNPSGVFIGLFLPGTNEEKTINQILDKVIAVNLGTILKEIIIINDCSKDNTKGIIEKYINDHGSMFHKTTLLVLLHTSSFDFIVDDGMSHDFSAKEEEQNDELNETDFDEINKLLEKNENDENDEKANNTEKIETKNNVSSDC